MERQLLERLIGAGVLVVLLVIVAPAILDGDSNDVAKPERAIESTGQPRRTHTIRLDQDSDSPPVAREVVTDQQQEPREKSGEKSGEKSSEANVEVAQSPVESSAPPVSAPQPKPEPKPQPKAEPKPQPKPEPKPEAKPATAVSIAAGWAVQLGSFSSQPNAQRLVNEVKQKGFSGYLMPLRQSGKTLYRVRVGPVSSKEQATRLAASLAEQGYKGQAVLQEPSG